MSGNAGYTKPVHMLLASTTRVAEQIKGRVLFVHTEVLKSGCQKAIAVMVDKDKKFALKSVLVHEAWAPADQARMRQILTPLQGKVVSITNAKIVPRQKSCVFFAGMFKPTVAVGAVGCSACRWRHAANGWRGLRLANS